VGQFLWVVLRKQALTSALHEAWIFERS
jgi:hypothetical protein